MHYFVLAGKLNGYEYFCEALCNTHFEAILGLELNKNINTKPKLFFSSMEQCFHMCDRMVIYFFIAASYAPWLNLRELGPWACHMRWLVWVMASFGTTYVFFFHE
ncbi:hypothetical protein AMECASPLE_034823, partial [Ameca splendens]